jgi:hypothetical protein
MYKQEDEDAEDRLFLHGFDRIEKRSAAIATNTRRKKLLLRKLHQPSTSTYAT